MRPLLILFMLGLSLSGCVTSPNHKETKKLEPPPEQVVLPANKYSSRERVPELDAFVGQHVILHGVLHRAGKYGPFLLIDKTPIYMRTTNLRGTYTFSKTYVELDEQKVEVRGVLHYMEYPVDVVNTMPAGSAAPINHYWFKDETIEIHRVSE